jgi:hypothetical protein
MNEMHGCKAAVTYYDCIKRTEIFVAVDSVLSALSRLEDKAFLAKQQELPIPSLEEDLEEFAETSSSYRFKRNAMEKHRLYPVGSKVSLTTQPALRKHFLAEFEYSSN